MAAINGFLLHAPNNDEWIVGGSFAPNGSSAVDGTTRKGKGWSVAWTSTGLFTITFNDKWNELVDFQCGLQQTTLTDRGVKMGAYTAASKTITIQCFAYSAPTVAADIAAVSGTRIHFHATFRNSAVPPSYG
jgi:hypothetical protein